MEKYTIQTDNYQITASLEVLFSLGLESHIEQMKKHFKPGNIIFGSYWCKYDKVLEFRVNQNWNPTFITWEVLVANCDPVTGELTGEERVHCTQPNKNDKVVKFGYERLLGS